MLHCQFSEDRGSLRANLCSLTRRSTRTLLGGATCRPSPRPLARFVSCGDTMRLWTLHPKYLDAQGLVALWREALLAREVLRGRTKGYRRHPQLQRFRSCASPRAAINRYLAVVFAEAQSRSYKFDRSKLGREAVVQRIPATDAQLLYEWRWLLSKLRRRSPIVYRRHLEVSVPSAHPLFKVVSGPVAEWEHVQA
jgi:Pyrimidine dimer DNA glycosylase